MADQHEHWFFKNEHIANLLSLSEKIGNMVLSINEAMTRFAASDTFANLVKFFQSIPTDIQETELFQRISGFEKAEITYADVEWLQESFGYMTYDMAVDTVRKKTESTPLDAYALSVVESSQLSHREKTIVLLAHFEELVYQAMDHKRQSKIKSKE